MRVLEKWSHAEMSYQTELRNKNRGYMKLIVWQRAMDLFDMTWRMTHGDVQIDFKLRSQLVDAAQSVSANIAEGYALGTTTQFVRYLRISLGSAAELGSHLEVLRRLKLIEDGPVSAAITLCSRVIAMLVGLLRKLGRRSTSRFPFPVSRFSVKSEPEEPS